jgi:hypothetical protein
VLPDGRATVAAPGGLADQFPAMTLFSSGLQMASQTAKILNGPRKRGRSTLSTQ